MKEISFTMGGQISCENYEEVVFADHPQGLSKISSTFLFLLRRESLLIEPFLELPRAFNPTAEEATDRDLIQ